MMMNRIFYSTDLHGSEVCFTKFVNAAKFYKTNILILGGDLTGKAVAPISEQPDGTFTSSFLGHNWVLKTPKEVDLFEKRIRNSGQYPFRTNLKEMEELSENKSKVDEIYLRLMTETLQRWMKIAEERLKGTSVKMYATGGNDDPLFVEKIIRNSDYVIDPEGEVIQIDKDLEMISCGNANMTPWRCPRDVSEAELEEKIEAMASRVNNMKTCIFNLHCPPINSRLDTCIKLDPSVTPPKPVIDESGNVVLFGAGSSAVRAAIEKYQPLLGLHGHIHESYGAFKIKRTLCVNPGSEYAEGILRGVIVNDSEEKIKSYQFTSG